MRRVIELIFYALFIIVPLILTPWNYELFEFNKMLTVYAGAIIIAGAWIIESIREKRIIFRRTPFDFPLILFLLSQILSTIFSIDPHTSIWGYYSRFNGGLMSTVSYLILYWAYAAFMTDKTKKAISVILSTGLLVSLYAAAEHFGIDKHVWIQDVQNRVFSTLGQPNWLAAYLIMLIPLAWAQNKKLYYIYSLFFMLALWFTKSRSGFLGFGAAVGVFSLIRLPKISLVILGLGLLALLPFRKNLINQFKPGSGPDANIPAVYQGGSSTVDIRRVVWSGAIEVWKHYPVFGSGVETFAYSYYNYRLAEHNLLSEWDYLYNKAHNEFVNFLATTGAVGLLTYLLIIVWFSALALKKRQAGLMAGYAGLAVSNFFGFSVVPVSMLFFLYPAFLLEKKPDRLPYRGVDNWQAIMITAVVLISFYGLMFVAKMWRSDFLFNLGRNQVKIGELQTGYQNLDKAVILSPKEPVFRNDLAEAAAQLALGYANQTDPKVASAVAKLSQQYTGLAVAQDDEVIKANKVNLNFWRSRIKIFLLLAAIDKNYYPGALDAFDKAITLSPTDAKLYYNLGLVYNQLGQTGLAEQMLVQTVGLKPNYEAARQNLGMLYEQTKRPDLAREQYEYIVKYLNPENSTAKAKLGKL